MQIKHLAGFVEAVNQIVDEWTPEGVGWYLQPWFRGHGDASWSLEPGWYRVWKPGKGVGAGYYREATLLEEFKLRAPIHLQRIPATDWEWLFLMQHYGLPTRLLDWTESSMVALYFAVRDNPGDRDAAVWVMNPWWLNKQTFGDYALFPVDDRRANSHAPLRPRQKLRGTLPLAITPIQSNERIVAQRGVFTIHGTVRNALDRLAATRRKKRPYLRQLVVPRTSVDGLGRELAVAGISESLIFPELGGLCRELKRGFFGI
jgi:hypothetical protein